MERVMMDQGTVEMRLRELSSRLEETDREDAMMGHGLDEWRMGGRGNGCGEVGVTFRRSMEGLGRYRNRRNNMTNQGGTRRVGPGESIAIQASDNNQPGWIFLDVIARSGLHRSPSTDQSYPTCSPLFAISCANPRHFTLFFSTRTRLLSHLSSILTSEQDLRFLAKRYERG